MTRYSIETRTRKFMKCYKFLSFARNLSNKDKKGILDSATKIGLYASKIASEKVVNKTAEAAGKLLGKKIAEKIGKPNLCLMWIQEMLKK